MSSLSPRASLSNAAAATAVSEDFGDSLKDLTQNNRYEISNLTIIAKENTEYAQAISGTLVGHIKSTTPASKLPALYVLDSIVKNVGTPYTVYIGRNLYSIFMDAYTLVDTNTRRAMEGMLKTWKEPVPGSLDKRSVFPPEVVRPIENALIKAKTAALQHQRLPPGGYRATPTPPQITGQFDAPPPMHFQQGQQFHPRQPPAQSPYQHTPAQQQTYPYAQPPQQPPGPDLEAIKRDLAAVIARTQGEFASNPSDAKVQQKMQALLDLQRVLNTTQLPPQSLQAIAAQISQLAVPAAPQPPQPMPTPPVVATPQWQPPQQAAAPPLQLPFQPPAPYVQPPSTQPPPFFPPPPLQMPALNPAQLSSLAALMQNTQKPSTPQMRAAAPALEHAPHAQLHNIQSHQAAAPAQPQSGTDLLSSLMKAGLMKPPSTAPPPPVNPPPAAPLPAGDLASLLNSLHKRNPSGQQSTPGLSIPTIATASNKPHIPPTNASLRTFRPELLRPLYADLNNQCSTCGRRFPPSQAGREKKSRHLDWHFRINQRLAETTRAAHHRHWFPDALAWINLEDFDESTASAEDAKKNAAAGGGAGGVGGKGDAARERQPEDLWVRAPAGVTRQQCPICYEEMRSSHPEELQDWVFKNAVWNNGRICHASCLAEMMGGSLPREVVQSAPAQAQAQGGLAQMLAGLTSGREGSRTPDSALGKRKAEESAVGTPGKMRREF